VRRAIEMKRGAGSSRESWRRIHDPIELCGSGRLGTSCHSMTILEEGRKKSSLRFRGNFGETRVAGSGIGGCGDIRVGFRRKSGETLAIASDAASAQKQAMCPVASLAVSAVAAP
jgi:hypothetical protein